MRSFCTAKAPHIFLAKNISTLDFRRTRRLNESLTNDFVKLMMLWALIDMWKIWFSFPEDWGLHPGDYSKAYVYLSRRFKLFSIILWPWGRFDSHFRETGFSIREDLTACLKHRSLQFIGYQINQWQIEGYAHCCFLNSSCCFSLGNFYLFWICPFGSLTQEEINWIMSS